MTIPHNDSMHILLDQVIARWCVQYSSRGTSSCSSAEEKANAVLLKMLIDLYQRPYARMHGGQELTAHRDHQLSSLDHMRDFNFITRKEVFLAMATWKE